MGGIGIGWVGEVEAWMGGWNGQADTLLLPPRSSCLIQPEDRTMEQRELGGRSSSAPTVLIEQMIFTENVPPFKFKRQERDWSFINSSSNRDIHQRNITDIM